MNKRRYIYSIGTKLIMFVMMFFMGSIAMNNVHAVETSVTLSSSMKEKLSDYNWKDGWSETFSYTTTGRNGSYAGHSTFYVKITSGRFDGLTGSAGCIIPNRANIPAGSGHGRVSVSVNENIVTARFVFNPTNGLPIGKADEDGSGYQQAGMRTSFVVNKYGSLTIVKRDKSGKQLDGAKFKVTGPDGYSKSLTVNGSAQLDNLKPGTYKVKETDAPKGYVASSGTKSVKVKAGKESTVVVTNEKRADLKIGSLPIPV